MRIAGVTLPDNKQLLYSLPIIFGIGPTRARLILKEAGIPENKKGSELTADEAEAVRAHLEKCQHCAEVFEFDAAVVRCLKAKLSRIDLPPDLMAQLTSRLDTPA